MGEIKKIRNRTKSLSSKIFFSMVSIALTCLLIVSIILFFWFRDKMIQEYRKLAMVSLSNVDVVFNNYLNNATNQAKEWFGSSDGILCRIDSRYYMVNHMDFVVNVKNTISNVPYAHSVYFLNKDNNVSFMVGKGVSFTEDLDQILIEKLDGIKNVNKPFVWRVKNRYEGKEDVPILTVYFRDAFSDMPGYNGAAIYNIDVVQLGKNLFTQNYANGLKLFIVDENGIIAAHSDAEHFGEDWSQQEYINRILRGDTNTYKVQIEGKTWEFNSIKSLQEGFYIVAQSEYVKNVSDITYGILLVVFSASVMLVSIVLFVTGRLFRPFRTVISDIRQSMDIEVEENSYDEVKFLDNYYRKMHDSFLDLRKKEEKDFIVKSVLLGSQKENIQELLLRDEIVVEKYGYYLILAYIPDREQENIRKIQECDMQRSMLNGICFTVLQEIGNCTCFEIGLCRLMFILSETAERKIEEERLEKALYQVFQSASSILPDGVMILVSERVVGGKILCEPIYKNLEAHLHTMLIFKSRGVAMTGDLFSKGDRSQRIKTVIDGARRRDKDLYVKALDRLLDEEKNSPYESFVSCLEETALKIADILAKSSNDKNSENQRKKFRQQIKKMTNKKDIMSWFMVLYDETEVKIKDINSYSTMTLMENAVDYIRNNYDDKALNVNMLAEHLSISAPYFGKMFREFAGCSAVEYITKVRMEKAHDMLLANPEKEVIRIADAVGYSNNAYFATAFKKYYGVSPSKYRSYHVSIHLEEKK